MVTESDLGRYKRLLPACLLSDQNGYMYLYGWCNVQTKQTVTFVNLHVKAVTYRYRLVCTCTCM